MKDKTAKPILVIRDLSVTFSGQGQSTVALKDFNFEAKEGEFISIIGPSGCGKTTLLHSIAGLQKTQTGQISIEERLVAGIPRETSLVFQDPLLLPWETVLGNITFGARSQGRDKLLVQKEARQWTKLIGLAGFESYYPHQLSGGMRQRVNLARALVCNPQILLLDEPFASVDAQTREILANEILKIWLKTKKTFIFVTHQITEALFLADRVIVMSASPGTVIEDIKVDLPRHNRQALRWNNKFVSLEKYLWSRIQKETKKMFE